MKSWILAVSLLAIGTIDAAAQTPQQQALVMTAHNLMADDSTHQEHLKNGGDANAVFPGDVLEYRLVFTNVTEVPVQNVEFTDPLPNGLQYVAKSAKADRDDVAVEYSIDGGTTYSTQPMVEEIVNGQRVTKPAPPEQYTHIRWRVEGWVQPGATVSAELQAMLPDAGVR